MNSTLQKTLEVVANHNGDKKKAAKQLGVSVSAVYQRLRRIRKLKIETPCVNDLAKRHVSLAENICRKASLNLPASVDRDGMLSAAFKGLMDASRSFDPNNGTKFSTYAHRRITGAIKDYLRDQDHVPRLTRQREKDRAQAEAALVRRSGRTPTDGELCEFLDWTPETLADSYPKYLKSLEVEDLRGEFVTSSIACEQGESPLAEASRLRDLFVGMTMDEQTLLYLYYYKRTTMKSIGAALQVCEAQISHMHAALVKRLRDRGREWFVERAF